MRQRASERGKVRDRGGGGGGTNRLEEGERLSVDDKNKKE